MPVLQKTFRGRFIDRADVPDVPKSRLCIRWGRPTRLPNLRLDTLDRVALVLSTLQRNLESLCSPQEGGPFTAVRLPAPLARQAILDKEPTVLGMLPASTHPGVRRRVKE